MDETPVRLDERRPVIVVTPAEAAMWKHIPLVAAHLAAGGFDGEEIALDA
jgi:hypothetical protein